MSTLPPRDYNSKTVRDVTDDIKYLKYKPKYRSITETNKLAIPNEWLTYLQTLKQYDVTSYSLEIINNIVAFLEKLPTFHYYVQFNPPKSLIPSVDENLEKIYSAYINKDNEQIERLLSNIYISLLPFILLINDKQNNLAQFENFSMSLINLSNIDENSLISKIQETHHQTKYPILLEILQFFQIQSLSGNLQQSILENNNVRTAYLLLNECIDKLLFLSKNNEALIQQRYLETELKFIFHEISFNLKLIFLTKNINSENINSLIELTHNFDKAKDNFTELENRINKDYQNISTNILPKFQTSYDQYNKMLSSLEERIQSLQAECSNLELAHYFKKEADKLKVDTDITHGWWTLTKEYIYHPYSRWLLLTIIGMISIFCLTFYITFSLEANINNYQDLIKYSPMYMVLGWFTWFSSKQFSYIKQLHDEYRYKYVLSKSYFAYRKEAENLVTDNKEALLLLLKCVIANISISPVQSVRPDVHTPFSEILNTVSKVPLKSTDDKK